MKVNAVTEAGTVKGETPPNLNEKLLIAGFGVVPNTDLVEELKGNSDNLRVLAEISRERDNTVVAAFNATLYGKLYRSAAVIDCGRILGISDMTHNLNRGFDKGHSLRLYGTSCGVLGVVVGDDILFPECVRALSVSGACFVIHLTPDSDGRQSTAAAANALFNGVSILSLTRAGGELFNSLGQKVTAFETNALLDMYFDVNDELISNMRPEVYQKVLTEC